MRTNEEIQAMQERVAEAIEQLDGEDTAALEIVGEILTWVVDETEPNSVIEDYLPEPVAAE